MAIELFYIVASIFAVSLISFIGIFTLSLKDELLQKIVNYLVAFSAGALFGEAFLHMLPEIQETAGFTALIGLTILLGIVIFFVLEKIIKWHHCHNTGECEAHPKSFSYMNLVGDGVHNLIDGMIIAGAYMVSLPIGITTTIAVALHEIPQEMGDFGVLVHGGMKKLRALQLNFLSALTAFIGAGLALYLGAVIAGAQIYIVALAAGGFIYIAGSDLIPELHQEIRTKNSIIQLIMFGLGILIMLAFLGLE